jgi:predicted aspartyl protease
MLALALSFTLLAASAGSALAASVAAASPTLSRQQVEQALRNATDGDVFTLADVLPRIEDPGLASLARARLAATQLDATEAHQLVTRYLADGTRSPAERALAWNIVADAGFAVGHYQQAADAAHAWEKAVTEQGANAAEIANVHQMVVMADQLATAPNQRVDAYAPKPESITRDKVGLPRAIAVINGKPQEVVLDTGANLSTISLSTARKLGLRMLDGTASTGSISRQAVSTKLGIADHFEFAGLSLSHVAFLVLDDDQLSMPVPGGYRIDAILGFPVLRELQRLEFTADDKLLPSRSHASALAGGNLRMVGNAIYVNVMLDDMPMAMQLDSGAVRSGLSSRFASTHPSLVKGLTSKQEHLAGAGGLRASESATWPQVRVRIGDQQTVLPTLSIAVSSPGDAMDPDLLGTDILRSFDHWTIDFQRMQFEVGKPVAKATASPRAE